jgi:hypothetical protein
MHLPKIIGLPLLAALVASAPLGAEEEKAGKAEPSVEKSGEKAKGIRRFSTRSLPVDFGPQEDGKGEKVHESMAREGWLYLFDSRIPQGQKWNSLGLWRVRNPGEPDRNHWKVLEEGGELILRNDLSGGGHGTDLISLPSFWDFDLHVELRVPPPNSNSGIYLRGRYEIQVDGAKPGDAVGKGSLGAIYNTSAPSKNASKGPGAWQTIDAEIRGFRVLVRLNGEVIQENVEIPQDKRGGTGSQLGTGDGVFSDGPDSPGPIFLQGDHGDISFRNVRIRPLRGIPSTQYRFPGRAEGPVRPSGPDQKNLEDFKKALEEAAKKKGTPAEGAKKAE